MKSFFALVWALPIVYVLALDDSTPATTVSAFQSDGLQCYVIKKSRTSTTSSMTSSFVSATTTSDTSSLDSSTPTSTTSSSSELDDATTTTSSEVTTTTTSVATPTSTCYTYVGQDSASPVANVLQVYLSTDGQGSCSSGSLHVSSVTGTLNTIELSTNTGYNYGGTDNCVSPDSPFFTENGLGFTDTDGNIYDYFNLADNIMLLSYQNADGSFSGPFGAPFTGMLARAACLESSTTTTTTSSSSSDSSDFATTTSSETTPLPTTTATTTTTTTSTATTTTTTTTSCAATATTTGSSYDCTAPCGAMGFTASLITNAVFGGFVTCSCSNPSDANYCLPYTPPDITSCTLKSDPPAGAACNVRVSRLDRSFGMSVNDAAGCAKKCKQTRYCVSFDSGPATAQGTTYNSCSLYLHSAASSYATPYSGAYFPSYDLACYDCA